MADKSIKGQKTEIVSAKRNSEGNIEIDMNTKVVLEGSKWSRPGTDDENVDRFRQESVMPIHDMEYSSKSTDKPQTIKNTVDRLSSEEKASNRISKSLKERITMFEEGKNMADETAQRSQEIENNIQINEASSQELFVARHPLATMYSAVAFTILDILLIVICFYGLPDVKGQMNSLQTSFSGFSLCNLPVISLICMFVTCVATCIRNGA